MPIKKASNVNVVMSFNLGSDFDHRLYAVIQLADPKSFDVEQFLRFIKTPRNYDALSIDVISSSGLQMIASQSLPGMPGPNNPYAFNHFQISQCILLNNELGFTWTEYYQHLNNVIKSYGDVENVLWFFQKEAFQAYLYAQHACFHQVLFAHNEIVYPAWYEIQRTFGYGVPVEDNDDSWPAGNVNQSNNKWTEDGTV